VRVIQTGLKTYANDPILKYYNSIAFILQGKRRSEEKLNKNIKFNILSKSKKNKNNKIKIMKQ
jgi:hypothetical protein